MPSALGTIEIDFGAFPGSHEAVVTVPGQGTISTTSRAGAYVMADGTSTDGHTAEDHRWLAAFVGLSCTVPIAAASFDIQVRSPYAFIGKFKLQWVWADS